MATTKVDINLISATGTASSSTFLRGDGAWQAPASGITLGTEVASTSGTAVTFTGIASGTKRITINLVGVSQGSASQTLQLQIGDSGGVETSGYTSIRHGVADESVSTTTRATDCYGIFFQTGLQAADVVDGVVELMLEDSSGFQWNCWSMVGKTNADAMFIQVGTKALSAELTQLKMFTNGGATFDLGAVNIMTE